MIKMELSEEWTLEQVAVKMYSMLISDDKNIEAVTGVYKGETLTANRGENHIALFFKFEKQLQEAGK